MFSTYLRSTNGGPDKGSTKNRPIRYTISLKNVAWSVEEESLPRDMEDRMELTVLSGKNVERTLSATKKPRNKTFLDVSKLKKLNMK